MYTLSSETAPRSQNFTEIDFRDFTFLPCLTQNKTSSDSKIIWFRSIKSSFYKMCWTKLTFKQFITKREIKSLLNMCSCDLNKIAWIHTEVVFTTNTCSTHFHNSTKYTSNRETNGLCVLRTMLYTVCP